MTDARRGWLDQNIDAPVFTRACNRGHSSAVEHRIADPAVAGSNPAGPFLFFFAKQSLNDFGTKTRAVQHTGSVRGYFYFSPARRDAKLHGR